MAEPFDVAAFRVEHRRVAYGGWYRGWAHFAFTSLGSLTVIAIALAHLRDVRPLEWLTLPVGFLLANMAEYLGHRGPMHKPAPGLGLVYRRHSLEHHRFFVHDAMAFETTRDFKMVLFPPVMLLFFLGGIATPLAALCFVLLSPNVGWLFVALAVGYFLTYEWLHFCYHLPPNAWPSHLPGMAALRRHHTAHHNLSLMGRWNFNITFPICDAIFGTQKREP